MDATTLRFIQSSLTEERLRQSLVDFGVPEHTHDGYVRYIREGYPPGHFLLAVLSNDLFEACARADEENQRTLVQHVRFLYNSAPRACCGSTEQVEAWIAGFAQLRAEGKVQ